MLDQVRSIRGVKFAVPLYSGGALVKLRNGAYQAVNVIGLDDSSLMGRPDLISGNIENIFAENAFIAIRDSEFSKLENPDIGTEFELNDHRGVIVGIGRVASSGLFGVPTLYTTYTRCRQYLPNTRFTISYALTEPKSKGDIAYIKQEVAAAGYRAVTDDEFIQMITQFYMYRTGIGTNMLLMTIISFVIGLNIAFLARRVLDATRWLRSEPETCRLPVGYFGASTGAAAALVAAAERPSEVAAVVSRGGRPDLAGESLAGVKAPTLLIVGGNDLEVIDLNAQALLCLSCEKDLRVIPDASHLFAEPGALEKVGQLARDWFERHLSASEVTFK